MYRFEDFYDDNGQETIYVSTIHKSKGREFDSVYMMLKNAYANTDEERRKLYVGMTRAKSKLHIHTNKDFFLIKDCCLTELNPEEVDENGVGRTLTCIGFRPLPDELAHQISRKYQLYR